MHTPFHQVEYTLTSPYEQVSMLLLNLLGLQNQGNDIPKNPFKNDWWLTKSYIPRNLCLNFMQLHMSFLPSNFLLLFNPLVGALGILLLSWHPEIPKLYLLSVSFEFFLSLQKKMFQFYTQPSLGSWTCIMKRHIQVIILKKHFFTPY